MSALAESVRNASRLKKKMLHAKVREAVYEQRNNTYIRRGILPPAGDIDNRTVTKIRKRLGAKNGKLKTCLMFGFEQPQILETPFPYM